MITLDIFGTQGKNFLKYLIKNENFNLEEIPNISNDFNQKGFAGRMSFADEDRGFIADAVDRFNHYGGDLEWEVVSGYFPFHLSMDCTYSDEFYSRYIH